MQADQFKAEHSAELARLSLPAWARVIPGDPRMSVTVEIDMDAAMQDWLHLLQRLQVLESDPEAITQYWLECAYQCAKMDVQESIVRSAFAPHLTNQPHEIRFTRADAWKLTNFPEGRGIDVATKGKEAREHYKRIRGRLPF